MGHPGTLGMTKWGFALPRNVVADGWVERKSSGNLISYAPTRLNLFHKIQAEKPCLPANLTALEPDRSEQQHVRDAIGSEGHRRGGLCYGSLLVMQPSLAGSWVPWYDILLFFLRVGLTKIWELGTDPIAIRGNAVL